jgi:hypothetical protein
MPDFSSPYKAITWGKDFNFFRKLDVSISDGYFPNECQILIPFSTQTVTFQLESGGPLEYSFNGNTLHGDMTDGYASESLTFQNRALCKIWFRGTGSVRVEAWGIR